MSGSFICGHIFGGESGGIVARRRKSGLGGRRFQTDTASACRARCALANQFDPRHLFVYETSPVKERASIIQSKTQRPVQFEITEGTRSSVLCWVPSSAMFGFEHLWARRFHNRPHISTRQYGRMLKDWVASIGLEPSAREERVRVLVVAVDAP